MNGTILDSATAHGAAADEQTRTLLGWKTVLFNCDCHTFQDVALQLMKAIRCSYGRGMQYANLIHHTGCATVYSGLRERCEAVASVLDAIGLSVRVER